MNESIDPVISFHKEEASRIKRHSWITFIVALVVFLESFRATFISTTCTSTKSMVKLNDASIKQNFFQTNKRRVEEKKRKREESFERVNESQREELWNVYTNHFLIQPCVSAIWKKILAKGIEISRKGVVAALNADIDALVRERYYQFARDAVEHVCVQGFFAYTIVPSDARSGRLPYPLVVPWYAYEAHHGLSSHCEPELRCRAKNDEKRTFQTLTATRIAKDGTVNSPLASATKYCFLLEDAERNDVTAYNILSNPPVLTRHKTDHAFDSRDLVGGGVPGLMAQTEQDNMQVRNRINVNTYKQQQALIAALNDKGIDTASSFWESLLNPATGKMEDKRNVEYEPTFVPLPSDADVAQLQLPHARSDMVNFRRQCFEIISTAMGVPLSIVSGMSASHTTKANMQSDNTFKTTCDTYANLLSGILSRIFAESFTTLKHYEVKVAFPSLLAEEESRKTTKGDEEGFVKQEERDLRL